MAKIEYNQPRIRRHICSEEDIAYNFQVIADTFDMLGAPARPYTSDDAAALPTVDPSRAWVRFQLTSAFDGSTHIASADVVDAGGTALSPGESINVYDGVQRYVADAAGNEFGFAQQFEQSDGTLAWEPVSLGGLGSGGGGSDAFTVKVTSGDTTAKYLTQAVYNNNASPPAFNGAVHQEVFADTQGASSTNQKTRFYTSSVSATDSFQILVSSNDTTAKYAEDLWEDPASVTYDEADHMLVEFRTLYDNANEKIQAWIARDRETGWVRVDANDTLQYVEEKFVAGVFDVNKHDTVLAENVVEAGNTKNLKLFVQDPRVVCKANDQADYLPDKFWNDTATPYASGSHIPVYTVDRQVGNNTKLDAYLLKSDINDYIAPTYGQPFVCKITSTLSAASWSPTLNTLTPGGGSATLMVWDGSKYTEGSSISPEWIDWEACNVSSGKCKIGVGVIVDGRYVLHSATCTEKDA